jgi:hypothetical protein
VISAKSQRRSLQPLKSDHGALPAEDAVAVFLDVLAVLEKKLLTGVPEGPNERRGYR